MRRTFLFLCLFTLSFHCFAQQAIETKLPPGSASHSADSNTVVLTDEDITIYPYPKKLVIRFEVPLTGCATLTLRDRKGNELYTRSLGDLSGTTTLTIDTGELPSRPYKAELQYKDQTIIKKLSFR